VKGRKLKLDPSMLPIIGESKKIANIIHEEKVYVDRDSVLGIVEDL
jgi:hypothetical protein